MKSASPNQPQEPVLPEGESVVPFDYPAAARSLALWLAEFCDPALPFPRMIAEAGRRAALALERSRTALRAVERERDEWAALAEKYGHHATATLDKRTRVLTGSLMIALDVMELSRGDAVAASCADLARQFRAAAKKPPERAPVPAVDKAPTAPTSWSTPDKAVP